MKRKSNLWIAFCLATALSLLVGCGSGGNLKEVKLPDSMTVTVGDVVPVPYEFIYDGAQAEKQEEPSFSWSSSDPSIAAVDAEGNLTAIAEGNCTVQLTGPDEISASVKVTVNAAAPKNPLVVQSAEMIADEETVIQIEGVDDPAAQGYQFSSDNPEIAEVDAGGKVIAHKSGVAAITVTSPDGESYTFSVTVYLSEQERDEAVASASKKNPDSSSAASEADSNKNNGTSGNNTGSTGNNNGSTGGNTGSTGGSSGSTGGSAGTDNKKICPVCDRELDENGNCDTIHTYTGYAMAYYNEAAQAVYVRCNLCAQEWPRDSIPGGAYNFANFHALQCQRENNPTYYGCPICGESVRIPGLASPEEESAIISEHEKKHASYPPDTMWYAGCIYCHTQVGGTDGELYCPTCDRILSYEEMVKVLPDGSTTPYL